MSRSYNEPLSFNPIPYAQRQQQLTVTLDDSKAVPNFCSAGGDAPCCDSAHERVRLQHRDQHLELVCQAAARVRHVLDDGIQERLQAGVLWLATLGIRVCRPALTCQR